MHIHNKAIQNKIEEELQVEKAKNQILIDNLEDLVYTYDLTGVVNYVSHRISEYGYKAEDIVGKHITEFIHPDDRDFVLGTFQQSMLSGIDVPVTFRIFTKSGDVKIVQESGRTFKNENGEFLQYIGIIRDLTKKNKAEKELAHNELKFRTIIESITDIIYVYDENGIINYISPNFKIYGYDSDDIIGHSLFEFFHPDDQQMLLIAFKKVVDSDERISIILRLLTKKGEIRIIEANYKGSFYLDDKTKFYSGIFRDITERKMAEDALAFSEAKYRSIVENIQDIVYTLNQTGIFTYVSPSIKTIGYKPEELTGRYIIELIHPADQQIFIESIVRLVETGEMTLTAFRLISKSDEVKIVEITGKSIVFSKESSVHYSGIIRDVTEQKKTEEELTKHKESLEQLVEERTSDLERINSVLREEISERKLANYALKKREKELNQAKEYAEKCNKAKGDFLANVSHEIRTPLNAIIGFCELILSESDPEKAKNYALFAMTESDVLLELINELLDMAKIDSGKITIDSTIFDLKELLNTICRSMNLRVMQKGLNLSCSIDEKTPIYIEGDPMRLRQVILNLLSNAIKFTDDGIIRISVKPLEEDDMNNTLLFDIEDTGIGIPEDKLSHIFDSFIQADGSTTRKYGGTGLGTTISKKLVEIMGGTIGAESKPGVGSRFWFTVPVKRQNAATDRKTMGIGNIDDTDAGKDEITASSHAGCRILLVEDYIANRDIAMVYLANEGFYAEYAVNGKEAVFMCLETKYDLILMDVQMPEMDGYKATDLIRKKDSANKETPILGMTANAYKSDLDKCIESGMDDVITKPIRKKAFIEAIRKWIQKGRSVINDRSEPPIDMNKLLAEFEMDNEAINIILSGFLSDTEKQILIIEEAVKCDDLDTALQEARKISGGASSINAIHLSKAADSFEQNAKTSTNQDLAAIIESIKKELASLRKFWSEKKWEDKPIKG